MTAFGVIAPHVGCNDRGGDVIRNRDLEAHRRTQQTQPAPSLPAVASPVGEDQWPGYRGPQRDGVVSASTIQLPWPESGPRLLWKQPVGAGHGSFAVVHGRAYTIEQRADQEVVACYAVDTGRELWAHRYPARFSEAMGGPGPRSTPTFAAGRIYALGATGVLSCLEADTGKVVWSRDILADASADNVEWAMSGSPLVADGEVYVAPGGKGASVVAYDAASGEPVWKSGSYKAGYASPVIATLRGTPHLLVFDAEGLSAYASDTGAELWHFGWKTSYDVNAGQPIVIDDASVIIASGYGSGCTLLGIGDDASVTPKWKNKNLRLKFSSAVLTGNVVYGLDEQILVALDVATGERRWKGGRYGYGQLVLIGEHLLIQCENGDLALVEATPEAHRELRRVEALANKTWNHPAVAESKLLIRNDREMRCYDLSGT